MSDTGNETEVSTSKRHRTPESRGRRHHVHLESTSTVDSRCHRCGQQTYTALSEGLAVRADRNPITAVGQTLYPEIRVFLSGGTTYVRTRSGHLLERDEHRIAAASPTGTIHTRHDCRSAA